MNFSYPLFFALSAVAFVQPAAADDFDDDVIVIDEEPFFSPTSPAKLDCLRRPSSGIEKLRCEQTGIDCDWREAIVRCAKMGYPIKQN